MPDDFGDALLPAFGAALALPLVGGLAGGEARRAPWAVRHLERIRPFGRLESERLDRLRERRAIGGERDQQPDAGLERVRGDRGEVGVAHAVEDELPGGPARRDDRPGSREREIEEEQVAAARGRRNGARLPDAGLAAELDRVDRGEDLGPALIEQREVRRGQPADGLAGPIEHPHRNLDERDVDVLADGLRLLPRRARARPGGGDGDRRHGGDERMPHGAPSRIVTGSSSADP